MFIKSLLLSALLVGVSCRFISPHKIEYFVDENPNLIDDDVEDLYSEHDFESFHPIYIGSRVRRQAQGVMSSNPDGTSNIMAKLPLTGSDNNMLSAVGGLAGAGPGGYKAVSGGLALDNKNGHGLSLTGSHIPDFGNQLTGAGKVNLFHNDNHDVSANAFATRNFPSNPVIPNFNTYGGGVDYMYKDKIGGSLSAAHTDLFKRTDYSAMGKLNLFKNPSSSLDFNAGATRSVSPFIPKSSWQPNFGLTFSKYF